MAVNVPPLLYVVLSGDRVVSVGSSGCVVAQANVNQRCVSLAERISSEVVHTATARGEENAAGLRVDSK